MIEFCGGASGLDCSKINKHKVKCKEGTFAVKATAKTDLGGGVEVTFVLDGSQSKTSTTKNNGTAKAKFNNAAPGAHEVCIEGCPDLCKNTNCA